MGIGVRFRLAAPAYRSALLRAACEQDVAATRCAFDRKFAHFRAEPQESGGRADSDRNFRPILEEPRKAFRIASRCVFYGTQGECRSATACGAVRGDPHLSGVTRCRMQSASQRRRTNVSVAIGNLRRMREGGIRHHVGIPRRDAWRSASGVNSTARLLQQAGIIAYDHSHLTILNRRALEKVSCECYGASNAVYRCLMEGP